MALSDYQNQDTINQSKRGTTDRSLGGVPVTKTEYVKEINYWPFVGLTIFLVTIIVLATLRVRRNRSKKA